MEQAKLTREKEELLENIETYGEGQLPELYEYVDSLPERHELFWARAGAIRESVADVESIFFRRGARESLITQCIWNLMDHYENLGLPGDYGSYGVICKAADLIINMEAEPDERKMDPHTARRLADELLERNGIALESGERIGKLWKLVGSQVH